MAVNRTGPGPAGLLRPERRAATETATAAATVTTTTATHNRRTIDGRCWIGCYVLVVLMVLVVVSVGSASH